MKVWKNAELLELNINETAEGGEKVEYAGVTTIGSYAFEQCYNLTNLNIPKGVILIDNAAFNQFSSGV